MATEWTEVGGAAAIILGAATGLLKGYQLLRSDKYRHHQDQGQALLGGYEKLVDEMRAELERVRATCMGELAAQKAEHKFDRAEWETERAELKAEISVLQGRLLRLENGEPPL
ncbi:MAG: hypothetical protein LC798_02980 [Chloroflexi bacterium]|nr:hypothetical protein [Chloroflexota bacterium]